MLKLNISGLGKESGHNVEILSQGPLKRYEK